MPINGNHGREGNDESKPSSITRRVFMGVAGAGAAGVLSSGIGSAATDESDQNGHPMSYYPVTDYGAKGDGETDDTAAIQAAIEDVINQGGGVVFFPAGTYRITKTLRIGAEANVVIEGVGAASTIFIDSREKTALHIGSGVDRPHYGSARWDQGSRHIVVRDITVDRRQAPTEKSMGIHAGDASFTTLQGVTFHNHGRGIVIGVKGGAGIPSQFANVVDCRLDSHGGTFGSHGFPDAAIKVFASADTKIHGTTIVPTNVGIDMVDQSNAVLVNQCTIKNEDGFKYGILARDNGFARYVTNSTLTDAREAQFRAEGNSRSMYINGSWLSSGDGDEKCKRGIDVDEDVFRVSISGNTISNNNREGVRVRGVTDVIMSSNTIKNNAAGTSESDSVLVDDGLHHLKLVNNRIWSETDRYGANLTGETDNYIVMGNDFTHQDPTRSVDGALRSEGTGDTGIIAHNLGVDEE